MSSLDILIHRLQQKADRTKTIVAGNHCRAGIFHPSLVKVLRAVSKSHDEGGHGCPTRSGTGRPAFASYWQ